MKYYLIGTLFLLSLGCQNANNGWVGKPYTKINGKIMGTTYHITYANADNILLQPTIDSLLNAINHQVSTYDSTSTISQFNQSKNELKLDNHQDYHFISNLTEARKIYEKTTGAFDPTVMPLVNYWGFGYTPKRPVTNIDSAFIQNILPKIGFDNILWKEEGNDFFIKKTMDGVELDFSAIAKGYAVDEVGLFFENRGIKDYLVEIGGEVRGYGKNPRGENWLVGIEKPDLTAGFAAYVHLQNCGMATSGDYRNFHEVGTVKYAHTINPATGFPEGSTLLSASVIADDCMTADALATAFMVMGAKKAFQIANQLKSVETYLIYNDANGQYQIQHTKGFEKVLVEKAKEQ